MFLIKIIIELVVGPIDPSDWEDFDKTGVEFVLNDAEDPTYIMDIVEAS